jgi:hypothetical protein
MSERDERGHFLPGNTPANKGEGAKGAKRRDTGGRSDYTARLREPIAKIAEWLAERDPELAEILSEDGPKMARLLGRVALNTKTPAPVVYAIAGLAQALEPLDAFGRLVRLAWQRWRGRRARRFEQAQAAEAETIADETIVGPPAPEAEPELMVTPDRFRADYEPDEG